MLVAVVPNPPQSAPNWAVLVVGALVTALVAVNELDRLLPELATLGDRLRSHTRARRSRPRPKTVVRFGLTLVLALAIGSGVPRLPELGESVWIRYFGCPHPIELAVLSSPDGLAPARKLAERYEQWTAKRNYGCPTVSTYVYATSTGETREALTAGWSAEHLRNVGPRPDLWLPDSGAEVDKLKATDIDKTLIAEDYPVASSPLVLGIASSTVVKAQRSLTWTKWLQQVRDVVRPDPSTSPMGEVATAVLYGVEQPVDGAGARAIELQIGQSLDRDGYPLGNGLEILCRHRQLITPRSAVIVSEQALVQFNVGAPLGGKCATAERRRPEDGDLQAFYPSDTRSLDYWFVRFTWGYPAQKQEAGDFGKWLTSADGMKALVEAGLRPPGFAVSEPLSEPNGVLPGAIVNRDPIGPDALGTAMKLYESAHRPGRVLLALDTSGSMAAPADTGRSRFDVASQGARRALDLMGNRDEFGLRFFPGGESVPIGLRDDLVGGVPRREVTTTTLDQTTPKGNTPLFHAIVDGVSELGGSNDEQVSALVVLTDGEDTASRLTLEQVRDAVLGQGVRIFVIAVGETRCASRALRVLTADTGGACHDADFASVEDRLVEVVGALWEGP